MERGAPRERAVKCIFSRDQMDEAALSEGSVTCPRVEGFMGKTVLIWGTFIQFNVN